MSFAGRKLLSLGDDCSEISECSSSSSDSLSDLSDDPSWVEDVGLKIDKNKAKRRYKRQKMVKESSSEKLQTVGKGSSNLKRNSNGKKTAPIPHFEQLHAKRRYSLDLPLIFHSHLPRKLSPKMKSASPKYRSGREKSKLSPHKVQKRRSSQSEINQSIVHTTETTSVRKYGTETLKSSKIIPRSAGSADSTSPRVFGPKSPKSPKSPKRSPSRRRSKKPKKIDPVSQDLHWFDDHNTPLGSKKSKGSVKKLFRTDSPNAPYRMEHSKSVPSTSSPLKQRVQRALPFTRAGRHRRRRSLSEKTHYRLCRQKSESEVRATPKDKDKIVRIVSQDDITLRWSPQEPTRKGGSAIFGFKS